METAPKMVTPPRLETEAFASADAAVARLDEIYERNTAFLRERFEAYAKGERPSPRVRSTYPFVRITTDTYARLDSRLSYGFVSRPGVHQTTLTRPALFRCYYTEQVGLLLQNHGVPVEIGESEEPIPLHFAYRHDINIEATAALRDRGATDRPLRDLFDTPDLATMDDAIVNGTLNPSPGAPAPLAMFRAARVDYSLHRLHHYTGTDPEHFQNILIFTNYQFYVDVFARIGREHMIEGHPGYEAFVGPENVITRNARLGAEDPIRPPLERAPQMPAFHLVAPGHSGITMINIGTGPSNARNITDHVAVLRPHAWLMLGHCAGLRNTQKLGDYVLAHAYVRDDHVLDDALPTWAPLPALAEVQQALEDAVATVAGVSGYGLKALMQTGTVATTDDRNWELKDQKELVARFNLSRAIALDMESATIAANGY